MIYDLNESYMLENRSAICSGRREFSLSRKSKVEIKNEMRGELFTTDAGRANRTAVTTFNRRRCAPAASERIINSTRMVPPVLRPTADIHPLYTKYILYYI